MMMKLAVVCVLSLLLVSAYAAPEVTKASEDGMAVIDPVAEQMAMQALAATNGASLEDSSRGDGQATDAALVEATATTSRRRGGWSYCAREGGSCRCNGKVRYGIRGRYRFRRSHGSTSCTNNVFGDPYPGVVKQCHCLGRSGGSRRKSKKNFKKPWRYCSGESGFCKCNGKIRYGVNGRYRYKRSNKGRGCTNKTFGDPFPGKFKHCHCQDKVKRTHKFRRARRNRRRSRKHKKHPKFKCPDTKAANNAREKPFEHLYGGPGWIGMDNWRIGLYDNDHFAITASTGRNAVVFTRGSHGERCTINNNFDRKYSLFEKKIKFRYNHGNVNHKKWPGVKFGKGYIEFTGPNGKNKIRLGTTSESELAIGWLSQGDSMGVCRTWHSKGRHTDGAAGAGAAQPKIVRIQTGAMDAGCTARSGYVTSGNPMPRRGSGYVIAPGVHHFTLHDHQYIRSRVPRPDRAFVTYNLNGQGRVNKVTIVQHVNGIDQIELFAGKQSCGVSRGKSRRNGQWTCPGCRLQEHVPYDYTNFKNDCVGTVFKIIIRSTTLVNGYAVYRVIPEVVADASDQSLTFESNGDGVRFGRNFIDINNFRIAEIDRAHMSISQKLTETVSEIFRHDAKEFWGPRKDYVAFERKSKPISYWNRKLRKQCNRHYNAFMEEQNWKNRVKNVDEMFVDHINGEIKKITRKMASFDEDEEYYKKSLARKMANAKSNWSPWGNTSEKWLMSILKKHVKEGDFYAARNRLRKFYRKRGRRRFHCLAFKFIAKLEANPKMKWDWSWEKTKTMKCTLSRGKLKGKEKQDMNRLQNMSDRLKKK